jgi:hypothetical protein
MLNCYIFHYVHFPGVLGFFAVSFIAAQLNAMAKGNTPAIKSYLAVEN